MCATVFPIYYLGPVSYYKQLLNVEAPVFDIYEHYMRQTYRNRIEIFSANGIISLSIPIHKQKPGKVPVREVSISYAEDWQKVHWRSIESAYNNSSFFEYYEAYFHPFYREKIYEKLCDWNFALLDLSLKLLKTDLSYKVSEKYLEKKGMHLDLRSKSQERGADIKPYFQVFSDRHGFQADLSILDLLFNCGPQAISYLK